MIKVTIKLQNHKIRMLKVTGHSLSAPYGEDLVCAGVSSVVTGGANALTNLAVRIKNTDGLAEFQVDDMDNETIQIKLSVIETQLLTIEETYSKYIKITRQEA
jgi:uncharacterized protein YsxB (DUF464 family)